jgi:phosphoribosylformylglycinamidine synthase
VPITGGNVSLYNETGGRAVLPTPVIGIVGLIEDASCTLARAFPDAGLEIVLLGENFGELGGSEYLHAAFNLLQGRPPAIDFARERALQQLLVEAAAGGWIRSAHDCADGGFAVALAECCFGHGSIGAEVVIDAARTDGQVDRWAATLFGESASRAIVSVASGQTEVLLARAAAAGVPAQRIGRTGGLALRIAIGGTAVVDCAVDEAETRWDTGLTRWFTRAVA